MLALALRGGGACMSAGKSFHSVSGRVFWYEVPPPADRFAAAAVTLGGTVLVGAEGEEEEEGGPRGLRTTHALSGRSLK